MDKNYVVLSPSYKRADKVKTHLCFEPDNFFYCVHEFEAESYLKHGHKIKVIPDSLRGSIVKVRNWMLDNSGSRNTVMADDDISSFFYVVTRSDRREKLIMSPQDLDHFIQNGYVMAEDCGASLWGVNVAHDPRFYTQNRPFSFSLPVLGTFSCHRDPKLRYDVDLPVKEDYDFFIQTVKAERKVLRFNMVMYIADHLQMDGGCQEYRTDELEKDNFDKLQQKWGNSIVSRDASKKDGVDFNPIIKLGI